MTSTVTLTLDEEARRLFTLWKEKYKQHNVSKRWRHKQYSLLGRVVVDHLIFLCLQRRKEFRLVAQCEITSPQSLERPQFKRIINTAKVEAYRLMKGLP